MSAQNKRLTGGVFGRRRGKPEMLGFVEFAPIKGCDARQHQVTADAPSIC